MALNQAVRWKLILSNPTKNAEKPSRRSPDALYLDADGAEELKALAGGLPLYVQIVIALGSGIRRGELLRPSVARHRHRSRDDHGSRVARMPRQDAKLQAPEEREVTRCVHGRRRDAGASHAPDPTEEQFLALGVRVADDTLLFDLGEGLPMNPDALTQAFRKFIETTTLPRMTWHQLRHSFATMMLEAEVDLQAVSVALGHSSSAITSKVYAHVADRLKATSASRLSEALRQARERRAVTNR